jgi:hypothetical protein
VTFRLFVSHSNPALARDLAEALRAAAGPDSPLQVLVDSGQIAPGDDWRRRIAFMLSTCDAAVVLLDEKALRSKWVLAESMYLSVRAQYDSPDAPDRFRLMPVLLMPSARYAEVIAELAAEHGSSRQCTWEVVGLRQRQFIKLTEPATIADAVLAALHTTGGLVADLTPAEQLADQLGGKLESAGLAALQRLAGRLQDLGDRTLSPAGRAALALIRELLDGGPMERIGDELLRLGRGMSDVDRLDVIDALTPLPFDTAAAAQLRREVPAGRSRTAAVRTDDPNRTPKALLQLAHLPALPRQIIQLTCAEGSLDSVDAELVQHFEDKLPADRTRSLSTDQIRDRLRGLNAYVVVPPLDAAVLTELESRYPKLTFVVWYPGPEDPVLPEGGAVVSPPLDPDQEAAIWTDIDIAMFSVAG